ncbi:MAG: hypothetical protein IKV88_00855 [Clostridia bacterium]|nr:hypothetical protein [Clostridia bacterium]
MEVNHSIKSGTAAEIIGLKMSRTKVSLSKMVDEGIIVQQGGNRNRTYRLKK